MIQAMYSGISGMKAFMTDLDVIGNNIANINTTGYKASRVNFQDMLSETLSPASASTSTHGGTNPNQVGLGTVAGSISVDETQGSMESTGNTGDLAIQGEGYFMYTDGSELLYSRDGSTTTDSNNNLVSSSNGDMLLGWSADLKTGDIDTSEAITPSSTIQIPIGKLSSASQTTAIKLSGNLNAAQTVGSDTKDVTFNIYDSLGTAHKLTVKFAKADNTASTDSDGNAVELATWTYSVYCNDVDKTNPVTSGDITFNSTGASNLDDVDISLSFTDLNGCVQPLKATISMSGISQDDGSSTVDLESQDGLQYGTLDSYSVSSDGLITGTFTNGSTRSLGQLATATFNNPKGLTKVGNNMLEESANSGAASVGTPSSGGRGSISGGYLEGSNADLATEFANMIVAQRGFQANSKIITTSDEVLQTLISMKQ